MKVVVPRKKRNNCLSNQGKKRIENVIVVTFFTKGYSRDHRHSLANFSRWGNHGFKRRLPFYVVFFLRVYVGMPTNLQEVS